MADMKAKIFYDGAVQEYRQLEEQAQDIQQKLTAKRHDVNQIAKMIGKPAIDDMSGPVSAANAPAVDVIDPNSPNGAAYTRNTISAALTGQPLRR